MNVYTKTMLPGGVYHLRHLVEETFSISRKWWSEKKKYMRCLLCEDALGRLVLFPMASRGTFYVAKQGSRFPRDVFNTTPMRVYHWTDFDTKLMKSLCIKMVHGNPPKQQCKFTGLLRLSHVTLDHNVICCTMTETPRLFEMAVTSEPIFNVAEDFLESAHMAVLKERCLKFAARESFAHMQAIKVRRDYNIDHTNKTY